jgi:hypothetical protein
MFAMIRIYVFFCLLILDRILKMAQQHTCQPLKPLMREISPSAMTAEGEILHERHFQPKYMTCTLYTSTKHQ